MRILFGAFAALLCCPAVAAAAPWAELPFRSFGEPPIRCLQAACGLRAVAVPRGDPYPTGEGSAQLDGPGTVRIRLHPVLIGDDVAPAGRRPLRVTVNGTAPGGVDATTARIDVHARRAR